MFTKTAVFIFSFVGIFTILFAGINSEFYAYQGAFSSSIGTSAEIAEQFNAANITVYSQVGNDTMTYEYSSYEDHWSGEKRYQMGLPQGQYCEVWWGSEQIHYQVYMKTLEFRHSTEMNFLGISWLAHVAMDIYDVNGNGIGQFINMVDAPIEDYYDNKVNASVFQTRSPVATSILVRFNQSKYDDIAAAWDAGELNYVMSYELDQNATMMNIWSFIAALLTFNSPAIGLTGFAGTVINAMIAIPTYLLIGILILKLVFAILPFIRGVDE